MVEVADEPAPTVTLLELKLTETPEGTFEAERLTVIDEAEPVVDVTSTVAVFEAPLYMLSLWGMTDIEKSLTYTVMVVLCVFPPPEPVTVTV